MCIRDRWVCVSERERGERIAVQFGNGRLCHWCRIIVWLHVCSYVRLCSIRISMVILWQLLSLSVSAATTKKNVTYMYIVYVLRVHRICLTCTSYMSYVYIVYVLRVHRICLTCTSYMSYVYIVYVLRVHRICLTCTSYMSLRVQESPALHKCVCGSHR